jgi:protein-S-isoprenylcysteine O-methyltransferase Ste14
MKFLLVVSAQWFFSEIALARLTLLTENETDRDRSTLRIIWLTIFLSIFLGIFLSNIQFGRLPIPANYLYYIGICCIVSGLMIRWIAILRLNKSFRVKVTVTDNQKLVTTGFYKFIRHPAYSGSLLSFLGLALVFNNWITAIVIFVPILFAFLYRIRIEEHVLHEEFGQQYQEYCDQSKRLIPGIY